MRAGPAPPVPPLVDKLIYITKVGKLYKKDKQGCVL